MSVRYRTYILAWLGAVAVFILFGLFKDILSGEEGRVRRFIMQGKRAVETKNIFACANLISTNYQDKYGNDRQSLIYAVREFFSYYSNIFISIEKIDIKLDDSKKRADVTLTALVVGQVKEKVKERILEGEKGRVEVILIKEDKNWQLLGLEFFQAVTIMGQQII